MCFYFFPVRVRRFIHLGSFGSFSIINKHKNNKHGIMGLLAIDSFLKKFTTKLFVSSFNINKQKEFQLLKRGNHFNNHAIWLTVGSSYLFDRVLFFVIIVIQIQGGQYFIHTVHAYKRKRAIFLVQIIAQPNMQETIGVESDLDSKTPRWQWPGDRGEDT